MLGLNRNKCGVQTYPSFIFSASQETGSSSQQMDDLFDILIQSGGKVQPSLPHILQFPVAPGIFSLGYYSLLALHELLALPFGCIQNLKAWPNT